MITVSVAGKAGTGKSAVVQELMMALVKLGFQVEVHSIEEHPRRKMKDHDSALFHALQGSPKVILEEVQLGNTTPRTPVLLLGPPIKKESTLKTVVFTTTKGKFTVEVDEAAAPKTVANFLSYVNAAFYDGTIFHRVIEGFMIQGGGFETNMRQKPANPPVENEAKNGLKNVRYSIAMARTGDPHSATAQFFINVADNSFLNYPGQDGWGYCVFGRVIEGQEVIDAIKAVKTTRSALFQDVPAEPVIITSAVVA